MIASIMSSTPGPLRVEVHPGRGDALVEEGLAGPVEADSSAVRGRHRPGRGHAEALLVEAAVGVAMHVAGRLVGAGEPRADHHVGRAGGERERDVARVAHAAVGPDVLAEAAGLGRRTPARRRTAAGRRRSSSGWCTWRPGPTPTLTMSAPASMRSRTPSAVTTLPGDQRDRRVERPHGGERVDHPLLVAVRGVDHQHVDAGGEQLVGPAGDVAVDADRGARRAAGPSASRPGGRARPAARPCG